MIICSTIIVFDQFDDNFSALLLFKIHISDIFSIFDFFQIFVQ